MKKIIKWAEPVIQTVISVLLLALMVASGLLPVKYLGIAVVLVLLLLALTFLSARSKNTAARSLGAILALVVCVVLIVAVVYLRQIMSALHQISGTDTQIVNVAVLVPAEDPAQSIGETAGYRFGLYEGADASLLEEMVREIGDLNGDADLQTDLFESPLALTTALLDGRIDAAVCNKAFFPLLEEAVEDFSARTRILYEKEFETEIDSSGAWKRGWIGSDGAGTGASAQEAVKKGKVWELTKEPFTVLISGIDVSGPINTTSRSDVNILMTVNPVTHRILLTTTPRDYYVYIPGISGDRRDKLTHAGIYGVRNSMNALENLYGIGISDYIRINFDSLVQLVDVLGGVDVNSEVAFDSGTNHFVKGVNHLNGEQALAFSRNRYAFEEGDVQRGKNQMLVLTAIIDKLQSPALLKNPAQVLDVIAKSMQTSITTGQITKVIAWQLDNAHKWQIDRQSVTGTGDAQKPYSMPDTELYVMWPDEASVREASGKIRDMMR